MAYSKTFWLSVLLVVAGAAAILSLALRAPEKIRPDTGAPLAETGKTFDIVSRHVHHEAQKAGKLEWTLDALSAGLSKKRNEAVFTEVRMEFLPGEGSPLKATADTASADTITHDAVLSGHVNLIHKDFVATTAKMAYSQAQDTISSMHPVTIKGPWLTITGNGMTHDINAQETLIQGNVKGRLCFETSKTH